jgi:hypothetical protein
MPHESQACIRAFLKSLYFNESVRRSSAFLQGAKMWMTVSVAAVAVPLLMIALFCGVRLDTPGANESGPRIGL